MVKQMLSMKTIYDITKVCLTIGFDSVAFSEYILLFFSKQTKIRLVIPSRVILNKLKCMYMS